MYQSSTLQSFPIAFILLFYDRTNNIYEVLVKKQKYHILMLSKLMLFY